MRRLTLLALFVTIPAVASGRSGVPAPEATSVELARQVIGKLHADRQLAFIMPKLAPIFATQVLNAIRTSPDARAAFTPYMQEPDGERQVGAAWTAAYSKAFAEHVPDTLAALAGRYARSLSTDALPALLLFLGTPAGSHWADASTALQQASSDEGARVGALAGAEAVAAALKSLAATKESAK